MTSDCGTQRYSEVRVVLPTRLWATLQSALRFTDYCLTRRASKAGGVRPSPGALDSHGSLTVLFRESIVEWSEVDVSAVAPKLVGLGSEGVVWLLL